MNTKDKSKLNGKDLISIGIFTAVYFILNLLIAAAMGFIPLVNMMIPFASSLVLGIPMMLYFSKIKKFGMVLITYIIYGAILTLAGVGIYSLIAGTLCALIAEFILKAKRYASTSAAILSYAVCSVGANANVLGFAFMTEAQLAEKTAYYGQEYMDIISGYFSHGYMLPLLAITAFAGGALGGLLGKAVLKKHFAKSGMILCREYYLPKSPERGSSTWTHGRKSFSASLCLSSCSLASIPVSCALFSPFWRRFPLYPS